MNLFYDLGIADVFAEYDEQLTPSITQPLDIEGSNSAIGLTVAYMFGLD